jgi:phosphonate transport system substrate-binding protein
MLRGKCGAFLSLFLIVAVFFSAGDARAGEGLTLGIHPFLPATELMDRFSPLAEYLGRETGLPVTISIARDYGEHIEMIGRDELDIAYMGPASYVKMVERYGSKPLLARLEIKGKPTFHGIVIVNQDSDIRSISDIEGRRFAFGDPDSTMSHLVPRYMLWEAGVDVEDLSGYEFLEGHHNVALGVLISDFDAGAVKEEVFDAYEKRGLSALAVTPEISEHVFVASGKIRPRTAAAIRSALYRLKDSKEGKAVMTRIKKDMTAMVPASDADYDNLRDILNTLERIGVEP